MSVLESAIGWLTPPECIVCSGEGSALCISCSTTEILAFGDRCWRCSALSVHGRACPSCRRMAGPRAVWINTNYEDVAQRIVQLYKFGHLRAARQPLARMMSQNILRFPGQHVISTLDYLVVPVPTATKRVRQRGFDHSALLAKIIARNLGLEYAEIIGRLDQIRQLGSKREDRLTQLSNSFIAKNPNRIAGRNILLIDDVITTGGTIITATKTLKAAGAKHVDALIFAKKL